MAPPILSNATSSNPLIAQVNGGYMLADIIAYPKYDFETIINIEFV